MKISKDELGDLKLLMEEEGFRLTPYVRVRKYNSRRQKEVAIKTANSITVIVLIGGQTFTRTITVIE